MMWNSVVSEQGQHKHWPSWWSPENLQLRLHELRPRVPVPQRYCPTPASCHQICPCPDSGPSNLLQSFSFWTRAPLPSLLPARLWEMNESLGFHFCPLWCP